MSPLPCWRGSDQRDDPLRIKFERTVLETHRLTAILRTLSHYQDLEIIQQALQAALVNNLTEIDGNVTLLSALSTQDRHPPLHPEDPPIPVPLNGHPH